MSEHQNIYFDIIFSRVYDLDYSIFIIFTGSLMMNYTGDQIISIRNDYEMSANQNRCFDISFLGFMI